MSIFQSYFKLLRQNIFPPALFLTFSHLNVLTLTVSHTINAGGISSVQRLTRSGTNEEYAVKVFNLFQPGQSVMLSAEVRALLALDCECLVGFQGVSATIYLYVASFARVFVSLACTQCRRAYKSRGRRRPRSTARICREIDVMRNEMSDPSKAYTRNVPHRHTPRPQKSPARSPSLE